MFCEHLVVVVDSCGTVEDRKARSVHEMNLDESREATKGTANVLCYLPAQPDADHQETDLSDCAVTQEMEVTLLSLCHLCFHHY